MPEVAVKHSDFWVIQFSPKSVEWVYLVDKLLQSVEVLVWNDYLLFTHEDSGDTVYKLKKERYSAEQIAKFTGLDARRIERMEVIYLDPPASNKDLPQPTVNYWGTA